MKNNKFVFDLDDTLYKEYTYVISAFKFFGRMVQKKYGAMKFVDRLNELYESGAQAPINYAWNELDLPENEMMPLIEEMQQHIPELVLDESAGTLLDKIRATRSGFCIVTDGRSVTQRAKILALGLEDADIISISEETGALKPSQVCFKEIDLKFKDQNLIYVGDNPKKDFYMPNQMGWTSVMLVDNGRNIHAQNFPISQEYAAQETVYDLSELECYL